MYGPCPRWTLTTPEDREHMPSAVVRAQRNLGTVDLPCKRFPVCSKHSKHRPEVSSALCTLCWCTDRCMARRGFQAECRGVSSQGGILQRQKCRGACMPEQRNRICQTSSGNGYTLLARRTAMPGITAEHSRRHDVDRQRSPRGCQSTTS